MVDSTENTTKDSAVSTFMAGIWSLVLSVLTGKNTIKAAVIAVIPIWIAFATSMAGIDTKYSYLWLLSIAIVPIIVTNLADYINGALNGDIWAELKKLMGQVSPSSGQAIVATMPEWISLKSYKGYVTAFVDVDKWRKSKSFPAMINTVKPANGDYYDIVASYGSKTWEEPNAWVIGTLEKGFTVCSQNQADPFADDTKSDTSANDIFLQMGAKSGADALQFIIGVLGGKGKDVKEIEATLILGPDKVAAMKKENGVSGNAYLDYVNDVNGDPFNLRSDWPVHLKHDPYFLMTEAENLYYKNKALL